MEQMDKLCLEGVYRQGFGLVPKYVMHDPELTLESKAIYAYLCALAGSGDVTFPYRETILRQLGLSKNTYYRHYHLLLENGYLAVTRPPEKTAANLYTLVQNPGKLPEPAVPTGSGRLRYRGLKAHGYGSLPRSVMMDEHLSVKAKGLYAYLCSYCGGGDCAFPRKDDIVFHLGISEPTYYKALNQLKDAGYLEVAQRKEKGRFAVNDYFLSDGIEPQSGGGRADKLPEKGDAAKPQKEKPGRKQSQTAPKRKAGGSIEAEDAARRGCGVTPSPDPKIWDIRNGDTIFGDVKNGDALYNNSSSSNSDSRISPSKGDDRRTALVELADDLMDGLWEARRQRGKAAEARRILRACGEKGGAEYVKLREAFVVHLQAGLVGRRVRNLRAYCGEALRNWLVEEPVRGELRGVAAGTGAAASYDLGELERMVSAGEGLDDVGRE